MILSTLFTALVGFLTVAAAAPIASPAFTLADADNKHISATSKSFSEVPAGSLVKRTFSYGDYHPAHDFNHNGTPDAWDDDDGFDYDGDSLDEDTEIEDKIWPEGDDDDDNQPNEDDSHDDLDYDGDGKDFDQADDVGPDSDADEDGILNPKDSNDGLDFDGDGWDGPDLGDVDEDIRPSGDVDDDGYINQYDDEDEFDADGDGTDLEYKKSPRLGDDDDTYESRNKTDPVDNWEGIDEDDYEREDKYDPHGGSKTRGLNKRTDEYDPADAFQIAGLTQKINEYDPNEGSQTPGLKLIWRYDSGEGASGYEIGNAFDDDDELIRLRDVGPDDEDRINGIDPHNPSQTSGLKLAWRYNSEKDGYWVGNAFDKSTPWHRLRHVGLGDDDRPDGSDVWDSARVRKRNNLQHASSSKHVKKPSSNKIPPNSKHNETLSSDKTRSNSKRDNLQPTLWDKMFEDGNPYLTPVPVVYCENEAQTCEAWFSSMDVGPSHQIYNVDDDAQTCVYSTGGKEDMRYLTCSPLHMPKGTADFKYTLPY
ncbi:MAG: hypothetical protein M1820_002209 [Bogoriella megaspora]|nr:MAG: hypothetical protein M1820_002209 [Bogoriella megaspora]